MSYIQVPLTNDPNQSFTIALPTPSGFVLTNFFMLWNSITEYWEIDISRNQDGKRLIAGLPLLQSLAPASNLIEAYEYLQLGEAYVVPISDDAPDNPAIDSWGLNYVLIWGVPDAA